MIRFIKTVHTVVWAIFVYLVFFAFYKAYYMEYDIYFWSCVVLVLVEGVILLARDRKCPLTSIAERYTDDRSDNMGIYLPLWLAKHNQTIFLTVIVLGIMILAVRNLILVL